jgi:hypothetical protein
VCARNWSSVGRGSYFNAHNIQTIGFQPTSYPKETCASQFTGVGAAEVQSEGTADSLDSRLYVIELVNECSRASA